MVDTNLVIIATITLEGDLFTVSGVENVVDCRLQHGVNLRAVVVVSLRHNAESSERALHENAFILVSRDYTYIILLKVIRFVDFFVFKVVLTQDKEQKGNELHEKQAINLGDVKRRVTFHKLAFV